MAGEGSRKKVAGLLAAGAAIAGLAYFLRCRAKAKVPRTCHRPLVVCGPSGVGKGTLLDLLQKDFPGTFRKCTSHTTRKPRAGEVDGVHYNFVTKECMKNEIAEGKFIEYAEVHGNIYGTSIRGVEKVAEEGSICILEIDVQGAEQVRKTTLNPYYFFFFPPSRQSLEKRLVGRGSENEKDLKVRLDNATEELDYMEKADFADLRLVNDNLDQAYKALRAKVVELYPQLA